MEGDGKTRAAPPCQDSGKRGTRKLAGTRTRPARFSASASASSECNPNQPPPSRAPSSAFIPHSRMIAQFAIAICTPTIYIIKRRHISSSGAQGRLGGQRRGNGGSRALPGASPPHGLL
jgi:hypothetical protein